MNYSTAIIFWVSQKRWLLYTLALGAVMFFWLPVPEGLTPSGYHAIIIILMTLILIIKEPLPLPGIAILIIFMQVLMGISTPNEVASFFMNDAVFFIMGSLMLAVAIVSQGLDKRLALGIIRLTGNRTWKIVAGFTAISALLSSFVGAHTVTAMMMPVGLTLIRYTRKDPRKSAGLAAALLFAIAYGATMGSIGTPSGGGRNVIMMNYWNEFQVGSLSYLEWMKYAYPVLLIEIPFTVILLLITFKPEPKVLDSAVRRLVIEVTKAGKISAREILSIVLFGLVFLGWVFLSETYGLGSIALMGVFLYMALGLVSWQELSKGTNWGVILLFGAAISIGVEMKETGGAIWIAEVVVKYLGVIIPNPEALQATVTVAISGVLSNLLSGSATVAVVGPIVLNLGGNPILLGLTTVIASSFGYFTAVGAPACTIIYSSGLVKAPDFLRAGWKMGIMSVSALMLVALLWWPILH